MNKTKKIVLLLLYFGAPAAALVVYTLFNPRLPGDLLYGISVASGVCAFTWLMFQFLLSSRLPFLERGVGLDRIMQFHRAMGMIIVLILIPHLAVKAAIFPFGGQVLTGALAFLGFAVAGFFASLIFGTPTRPEWKRKLSLKVQQLVRMGYERAKLMHNGTFLLAVLAALHIGLSSSGAPGSFLFYYFILVFLAGLYGYLYRRVISRVKTHRSPWRVEHALQLADGYSEITVAPPLGERLSHHWHQRLPGQFAFFCFLKGLPAGDAFLREEHPFTINSYETPSRLRITAKAVGDFTRSLQHVAEGDPVAVEGPFGVYSYRSFSDYSSVPVVGIAGGVGITPFIAMAEALREETPESRPPEVKLIWGVRSAKHYLHRSLFELLSGEWEDFTFYPFEGPFDYALLEQQIGPELLTHARFFICGPPDMMRFVSDNLRARGVEKKRILMERFSL